MLDHEGKEVPGNKGYKYFGAARDLPGVRELFEQERKMIVCISIDYIIKCFGLTIVVMQWIFSGYEKNIRLLNFYLEVCLYHSLEMSKCSS